MENVKRALKTLNLNFLGSRVFGGPSFLEGGTRLDSILEFSVKKRPGYCRIIFINQIEMYRDINIIKIY